MNERSGILLSIGSLHKDGIMPAGKGSVKKWFDILNNQKKWVMGNRERKI